jgi:hypothetical protein
VYGLNAHQLHQALYPLAILQLPLIGQRIDDTPRSSKRLRYMNPIDPFHECQVIA